MKYKETRFKDLFFGQCGCGDWRIFDFNNNRYSWVGEIYKSKDELLGYLSNFAQIRGYELK